MKGRIIYAVSLATVAVMLFMHEYPLLLTAAVAALVAIVLASDWSIGRLIVALFTFAAAATAEIIIVQSGIWTYGRPDAFGIPFWIPFVWVNGAFFFIQLKEDVEMRFRR